MMAAVARLKLDGTAGRSVAAILQNRQKRGDAMNRHAFSGALALDAFLLTGCPMPFQTSLLTQVVDHVTTSTSGPKPDLSVSVGGVPVAKGGATDAFKNAVQNVPFPVTFTIKSTGVDELHLKEADPMGITGT